MVPVSSTAKRDVDSSIPCAQVENRDASDPEGDAEEPQHDEHDSGDGKDTGPPSKTESAAASDEDSNRIRVERPLNVAGTVLTCIAAAFALHFGRAVLLPVVFALLIAVTLRPIVRRAQRKRIPESLSAAVLILGLVGIGTSVVYFMAGPARNWTSDLPARMEEVGEKLAVFREQVEDLEEASERLENITSGEENDESNPQEPGLSPLGGIPEDPEPADEDDNQPVKVEVRPSRLATAFNAVSSAGGVVASIAIALILGFFLLSRGDVLLNNLLHTLPTMREKRNVVEFVYDVEWGISRYLLTVTLINSALGLAIGTAMWLLGMPNPVLWGMMATLFNFVPYVGALAGTIVVFLVAVISFDSAAYACVVPVVYFCLTALEGNLITPSILGRTMQLNPIMVLLSLVFWGWMWGVGGGLLAVPILATLKIGFDRFERTRAIGTLLGGEDG